VAAGGAYADDPGACGPKPPTIYRHANLRHYPGGFTVSAARSAVAYAAAHRYRAHVREVWVRPAYGRERWVDHYRHRGARKWVGRWSGVNRRGAPVGGWLVVTARPASPRPCDGSFTAVPLA
jgi:hypothetical protein